VRWDKRGVLITAPPPLPWAASHAALPVPDRRPDGRLRLFFSARDAAGRSQIALARLPSFEPGNAADFRADPVVGLGSAGAFDDNGVTSSCLVEHEGRRLLYYTGWTLGQTVPFRFFVGCAASMDGGETFAKVSRAPVLPQSAIDPFLTASPWVLIENDTWRMWYVSGTGWEKVGTALRPRYHVKYAESEDGISWRADGHVCLDFAGPAEYAIGRPCVVRDDDCYRMWFCARGDAYRIGYAESRDGLRWERKDGEVGIEPSSSGWDSEMQAYPVVFDDGATRLMLYNGNGYGATGIGVAVLAS
jgi:hypothetical protein